MDKTQILEKLTAHLNALQAKGYQKRVEVDMRWLTQICTLIGIPKEGVEIAAQILSIKPPTKLIWLHMAECTGCSESLLRSDKPGVDTLMLDYISFEYHETLMGAVGFGAKKSLHDAMDKATGEYMLVIEGGVSLGEFAYYLTSGAESSTGEEECRHLAQHASVIFAVGTCSSFGGVQAAYPNPTQSKGVSSFLTQTIINIPGCPPSETNIVGTLMHYILLGCSPALDSLNRPLWSYGKNLHDLCERKAKFESGDFVQSFDDPNLEQGYCLYKVGCKGPYVANNCPKVKFNAKTSWPVRAGHGCIACSEPDFWDSFGHIEEPLNNANAYPLELSKIQTRKALSHTHSIDECIEHGTHEILYLELELDKPTRLYTNKNELLHLSFEGNLGALLTQLSGKNKLGTRLVENYHAWRQSQNLAPCTHSSPSPSNDISDVLSLVAKMFGDETNTLSKAQILKAANEYKFPHVSRLDFKLTGNANDGYGIEIDKAMRLPLCYLLGGLEIEGVSFGVVSSICEILCACIEQLCKAYEIEYLALKGNMLQDSLIQDRFATHLPQWLRLV